MPLSLTVLRVTPVQYGHRLVKSFKLDTCMRLQQRAQHSQADRAGEALLSTVGVPLGLPNDLNSHRS
jgi:hypothetical protein